MIKKTITYLTVDEETELTEEFMFNLNKAELNKLNFSKQGGFGAWLETAKRSSDNQEVYEAFENLILTAYGVPSADGKRFIKSQELRDEFSQSNALGELIVELMSNPGAAAEFFRGCLPKSIQEQIKANEAKELNRPQDHLSKNA